MAGSDKRFSLISVDADDDDVVIHAGVTSDAKEDADRPSTGRQEASSSDAEGAVADEPDGEDPSAAAADDEEPSAAVSDGQDASEAEQDVEDAAFQRAMERRRREREKNRMVTTEEDLHTPVPFAGMRVAIIVAGIVAVVAILVLHSNGML